MARRGEARRGVAGQAEGFFGRVATGTQEDGDGASEEEQRSVRKVHE